MNWSSMFTGIGAALTAALGGIAAIPYQFGETSLWIPSQYKPTILISSLLATVILKSAQSVILSKSKTKKRKKKKIAIKKRK